MTKLVWIAVAGSLGALARYGLAGFVQQMTDHPFPWGTAAVNLAGCFLFGFLWTYFEPRAGISPEVRAAVLTGFMGAFTTFSTFMFETGQLARDAQWALAIGNILLQNGVGFIALFAGLALARLV